MNKMSTTEPTRKSYFEVMQELISKAKYGFKGTEKATHNDKLSHCDFRFGHGLYCSDEIGIGFEIFTNVFTLCPFNALEDAKIADESNPEKDWLKQRGHDVGPMILLIDLERYKDRINPCIINPGYRSDYGYYEISGLIHTRDIKILQKEDVDDLEKYLLTPYEEIPGRFMGAWRFEGVLEEIKKSLKKQLFS